MNIPKYLVGTYVKINSSYFNEDIIGKTGVITDIYTKIQCFGTEKYTETFSYEVDILNVDKPILIKEEYLTPRPKLDFEAKIILLGLYKSGYKIKEMAESVDRGNEIRCNYNKDINILQKIRMILYMHMSVIQLRHSLVTIHGVIGSVSLNIPHIHHIC